MLTDRTRATLARIKRLEDIGKAMMQQSEKLYLKLEAELLEDHGTSKGIWVSNKYGRFLVEGVDNFTLDNDFQHEQPTLNGLLDGKGKQIRIIHTPWTAL